MYVPRLHATQMNYRFYPISTKFNCPCDYSCHVHNILLWLNPEGRWERNSLVHDLSVILLLNSLTCDATIAR